MVSGTLTGKGFSEPVDVFEVLKLLKDICTLYRLRYSLKSVKNYIDKVLDICKMKY